MKGYQMFKNREVKVTVAKKGKPQTVEDTIIEIKNWEDKTDYVLSKLQGIGTKIFLGVCVYITLDTVRQVTVAKATNSD